MCTIGFIPNPEMAATVVAWVRALAEKDEETKFLCFETGREGSCVQAVRDALDDAGDALVSLVAIDDPMPVAVVLEHVRKRNTRLLVTGPFALPMVSDQPQTSEELIHESPCQTLLLLYGSMALNQIEKILFVATARGNDRATLRLVDTLRKYRRAKVTMGGVEDETGAKPGALGERWIRGLLHEAALDDADGFEIKVVVDRLKHRGIMELYADHDLVVTGYDAFSHVQPLQQSLGDATVAIVKRSPPLRRGALADWLPRINPADHADLRYNLRQGSTWGPDFVGMLGLAAAIASLGLLQDSPAVVIGSMLLAPLMTPMIGLGMALGQASPQLMRLCGKSIGLGFLLTLAVSFLVGVITPTGETLPQEVLARGGPNVLDLLIAVFAAAAATYAMARPGITGAITGVAIATALVPPVCSVGVSLAQGAFANAVGATALFATNLVAIIVTSSFVFSVLGITAVRALPRYRRMARGIRWGLLAVLVVLAGPLSAFLLGQLEAGKNVAAAHPVTQAVSRALHERVAQDKDVAIMLLARPRAENLVVIHVASKHELPLSYADGLRKIVREEMRDPDISVSVVAVRGFWRSDADLTHD